MDADDPQPLILVVDDEETPRRFLGRILSGTYRVMEASGGAEALRKLDQNEATPDLVLLDILMPDMDGYAVCAEIQARPHLAYLPVVFVTGLGSEENRNRAFAAGGVAFIHKPFERDELLEQVRTHLGTVHRWRTLHRPDRDSRPWVLPSTFVAFKHYVEEQRNASTMEATGCEAIRPADVYDMAPILRMSNDQLARHLAHFLDVPYAERIHAAELGLGVLPKAFCVSNLIVPLRDGTVVVANPFDWELMHTLDRALWRVGEPKLSVAEPDRIRALLEGPVEGQLTAAVGLKTIALEQASEAEATPGSDALTLLSDVLREAVAEGASDVHIEPKEQGALIRFRIDGDMQDVRRVSSAQAARMLSRLKALAGMDIAERRKPQDGALLATLRDRRFKLRLATSSTTTGETAIIRLLDPEAEAKPLPGLGLTPLQASQLRDLAGRSQGMLFVVGPTGSGKSTTIFTLLTTVDGRTRSIMSVEDPVEYRIPYANQQQVNQRAGVTFEALLKSAMRQDPDVLFLGEVRDPFSARAVLDFASSGHLTISTLHSSNATTAIFRLERLGIERGAMADSIAAIVAQKLLKRVCPDCKEVGPINAAERQALAPYTDEPPETVARPRGCPSCRGTGFRGREGVFEVLVFDREAADRVREGVGIAELRAFCAERGDYLVSHHALEKVRAHIFAVQEVVDEVLIEESVSLRGDVATSVHTRQSAASPRQGAASPGAPPAGPVPIHATVEVQPVVLVVDDAEDLRALVGLYLEGAGYQVIAAADGVDALMTLANQRVDVILSDIEMPNLDGLKLMEILHQKGIDTPIVFLTATDDVDTESRMLSYGASDYIRKPVRKEVLLLRVGNALRAHRVAGHGPGGDRP